MLTLLKNARILTMIDNQDIFEGDILIENNRIKLIKSNIDLDCDLVIDCNKNLLMPGFKNAHTHSAMSFARSASDDLPLDRWLNDCIFPMEDKLSKQDQYVLSKISILEYLTSGITSCFDMYYNPYEMMQACLDYNYRAVLLGTVNDFRESVQEMIDAYKNINSNENHLIRYEMGFHAEYTCSDEILKELAKASKRLHAKIFAHSSETLKEVEECKKRHNGMTPVEYTNYLGLFDYGGGIFHGVVLSENDIKILKEKNVGVVSCPGSNSKLASGVACLDKYLENGLLLGLGTDGPGSNNGLDMFYEMRLASVLQKLINHNPASGQALDILKMATVGSAHIMGLEEADTLQVGKLADIIMIDLSQPNMQPINNIAKNIVYSGSKSNIKMTMVDGKILYMDHKFYVNENIEELYKKAQTITDRLKSFN